MNFLSRRINQPDHMYEVQRKNLNCEELDKTAMFLETTAIMK